MSDLIEQNKVSDSKDCPNAAKKPVHQKLQTQVAEIGDGVTIRRALPHRERRMIGAWCFLDHFGPLNLKQTGLDIPPHPHMGLQTFTWTLAGEILHRDSLGSEQIIGPGSVNLMTSGQGIAHSEQSLPDSILHGVQLWIALPDNVRNMAPKFDHYATMPIHKQDGVTFTLLAGESFNLTAPTQVYSPIVGIDVNVQNNANTSIPVQSEFEYGVLLLEGEATIENEPLTMDSFLYLGCGRNSLAFNATKDTRFIIIGGKPFDEEVLVWWNFVARTKDEITQAVDDWENQKRFGKVTGYQGGRLTAPQLKP